VGIERIGLALALASGLSGWPLLANAQQPAQLRHVGILSDESVSLAAITFQPFARALQDLGYVERRDIVIKRRYAGGDSEALASSAPELARLRPDVIFAIGTPAALAAKALGLTIPLTILARADEVIE
jgi:putative ABC transport system substrate-binding protein